MISSEKHLNGSDGLYDEQCDDLLPIYHQIVTTLTDILNIDSVRFDERLRKEIQGQLLEAQQKCREQRRRHLLNDRRKLVFAISSHPRIKTG